MLKRITLLLVAVLMAVALFGCSQPATETATEAPQEAAQTQEPVATEAPATEAPQEEEAPPEETEEPVAETRTYVDLDGVESELPMEIESVVDVWAANNQVLTLLGVGDRIVGTTSSVQGLEWMQKINPKVDEVPSLINGDDINTEEMLKVNPDVIITNNRGVDSARATGLPVANLFFDDYDGLKQMVLKTAEIFGDEQVALAGEFNAYFDENVTMVEERTADIAEEDKIKVYYARNDSGGLLQTDGAATMASEWIERAGGINIASALVESFGKEVSLEDILTADPDIIVLMDTDNVQDMIEELTTDSKWAGVTAVQNGAIYVNPQGVFYWERYSTEEAMQILWAGKTLYPELFEDIDLVEETINFYTNFFDYPLTEEEAHNILNTDLNPQ